MTVTPMPRQLERRASAVPLRQAPGLAGSSGVSSVLRRRKAVLACAGNDRRHGMPVCRHSSGGQVSTLPSIVLRDPHGTQRRA